MSRLSAAFVSASLVLLAACSDSSNPSSPDNPPPPAPVASVELAPASLDVFIGRSGQLAATTRDAAGHVLTGRTVAFTSSDASIATVDTQGRVAGIASGSATVTATSEGRTATAEIHVQKVPVATVEVAPATANVRAGAHTTLQATLRDDQNTVLTGRILNWSTSAPAIATVDANTGVVTGVAVGQATITAASEGRTASAVVTVTAAPVRVASITIAPALDTLEAYDLRQLQATLRDAQGNVLTDRVVTWTSSNDGIAAIDPLSILRGVDRGTVTITAASEGVSATAKRVVVIRYRSIAAGTMHACDLASGGIAWCWGLNGAEGRLGGNDLAPNAMSAVPVRVPGNLRFIQLVTFARHTCGLTAAGAAYCWGYNGWGALGAGSNAGQSSMPLLVSGGHDFARLTAGADHACGVTRINGVAYCWGNNDWRQLGTGSASISSTPVPVSGGLSLAAIAAGSSFTCGVTFAGAAYCWGANSIGQTGDGGPINYGNVFVSVPTAVAGGITFRSLSLGSQTACGLTQAGQAYCWGSNNTKFGNGSTTDASTPKPVSGGHTFQSISTGFGHVCGLTSDQDVYCWGANGSGQLGSATANGSSVPVRGGGSLKAAEVAAAGIGTGSGSHTCAIAADRLTVLCWGRNDVGQLGNGTTTAGATANITPSIVQTQKPLP